MMIFGDEIIGDAMDAGVRCVTKATAKKKRRSFFFYKKMSFSSHPG
jgi:hypothetical protein